MNGREWASTARPYAAALALAALLGGCSAPPAAETPPPSPTPEATLSPVWSDWSRLEPYEPLEAVYTRRYPAPADTLIPAGDYGPLIPFQGGRLSRGGEWGGWEDFYFLYGLVTLKGEVVLDPVLTGYTELATLPRGGPDTLLLSRMVPGPEGTMVERSALCARDGSWCTEFVYEYDWDQLCDRGVEGGLPLLRDGQYYVLLDAETGEEMRVIDLSPALAAGMEYPQSLLYNSLMAADSPYLDIYGPLGGREQCYLLNGDTGEILPLPREVHYVAPLSRELFCAYTNQGAGLLSPDGTWVVEPVYQLLIPTAAGMALAQDAQGGWTLLSAQGEPIRSIDAAYEFQWQDSYCKFAQGDQTLILDPEGQLRTFPPGTWTTVQDGWFIYDEGEELVFQRGQEERRLPAVDDISAIQGDYVLFGAYGEPSVLGNLATGELMALDASLGSFYPPSLDPISGRVYLESYREDGVHTILDTDGTVLAQFQSGAYYIGYSPVGELLRHVTETEFELLDREGDVVFRWRIPQGMD